MNDWGRPFTDAGFGNWFRDRCVEAGVPGRAHGLRKAGATIAANNGATSRQLMAIFGWDTPKEPERYTRAADQKHLAEAHAFARSARTKRHRIVSHRGGRWDNFGKKLSRIKAKKRWWCPGAVWDNSGISIGYDSQPTEHIPLNYNTYQGVFPTPAVSRQCARVQWSSVVSCFVSGSIPIAKRRLYKPRHRWRSVAQSGSAPRSGRGGRRFKSCHSDQLSRNGARYGA